MWGRSSSLIRGYHHPFWCGVCSRVVGVESWRVRSWVCALPQWRLLLKQVRSVWSQPTYELPVSVSVFLLRSSPRSYPFLYCIGLRSSANLWGGVGWGWYSGHCDCRNCDACAATWDLSSLCSRFLPGPVCPRSVFSAMLKCGVAELGHSHWEKTTMYSWPICPRISVHILAALPGVCSDNVCSS